MVESENVIKKQLDLMEDWYRAVIFDNDLNVVSSKNYEVDKSELK